MGLSHYWMDLTMALLDQLTDAVVALGRDATRAQVRNALVPVLLEERRSIKREAYRAALQSLACEHFDQVESANIAAIHTLCAKHAEEAAKGLGGES